MSVHEQRVVIVASGDYEFLREMVDAFEQGGCHVKQASSMRDCIRLLTGFTPDLMVLDSEMPGGSAMKVCEALSEHDVTGIPVMLRGPASAGEGIIGRLETMGFETAEYVSDELDPADLLVRGKVLIEMSRTQEVPIAGSDTRRDPNRLRVLLIDDEADQRTLLRLPLSLEYEVAEARNGLEGLVMIERFQPDVVVCDIMMPELDGMETLEAIRKNPRFSDLPFFFLSGEVHSDVQDLSKELGANLFLKKPIDPMRLLEVIGQFVHEMGIEPGSKVRLMPALVGETLMLNLSGQAEQEPESDDPVRILLVESDFKNLSSYREIRKVDPEGRWETYWNSKPSVALANLSRVQPDLIIYNPRLKIRPEVFARTIQENNVPEPCRLILAGRNLTPEETAFKAGGLAGEPLDLNLTPEEVTAKIMGMIDALNGRGSPKRHTLEEISAQDQMRDDEAKVSDPEMVERYRKLQNLIDSEG